MIYGIDTSAIIGTPIDWARVHSEGVSFAMCRATEADQPLDAAYSQNIIGIRANGMIPGAYHVLVNQDAPTQAQHFLAQIGNPEGLLLAVSALPQNPVSQSPTFADIQTFILELRKQVATRPILVRTSREFWMSSLNDPDATDLIGVYLWDRHLLPAPAGSIAQVGPAVPESWWNIRYGGIEPTLLTFSDSVTVAGITTGALVFRAERADLAALAILGSGIGLSPSRVDVLNNFEDLIKSITVTFASQIDAQTMAMLNNAISSIEARKLSPPARVPSAVELQRAQLLIEALRTAIVSAPGASLLGS